MTQLSTEFLKLAEARLAFEYHAGGVTTLGSDLTTGWRTLPSLLTANVTCEATLLLRDRDPVTVRPGQTVCLCPNVFHRIDMTSGKAGISRWSHAAFHILDGIDLFSCIDLPFAIEGTASRRIGETNEALAELHSRASPDLGRIARRKSLGFELLALVAERATVRSDRDVWLLQHPGWSETLEYIGKNLAAPLDIHTLAERLHLSVSRFRHVFRERTGKPPGQYIRDLRLARARQLLIAKDLPVKNVAQLTGYEDVFHFSRIFKKHCGTSPAIFREQIRRSKM